MIPSTAAFTTAQLALARKPQARCYIKDYSHLWGEEADDETNVVAGSASASLATLITPTRTLSVDSLSLFMKSDTTGNLNISVEIQTVSAGKPSGSAVTNGTGKIVKFTDLSMGWQKVRFENSVALTSGVSYYVIAEAASSTFSYFWGEDEAYTNGAWTRKTGGGSWANVTSGASLVTKLVEIKEADTGLITGLVGGGVSGIIQASAESWTPGEWNGRMCNINSSGASGSADNNGMSFLITSSTVSGLEVDLDPSVRGITVGDGFYIENLNNFQLMTDLVSFSIDDQRDRTINNALVKLQNKDDQFYEAKPKNSLVEVGNEVYIELGYSGVEYLQQFRGFIYNNNVSDGIATIMLQDVMGQFQRKPHNTGDIDGIAYENIVYRVANRYGLPFVSDPTNQTVSAGVSFKDNEDALRVVNTVRESLSWRLYGDNFGRVRFRKKTIAAASVMDIGQDDFILRNGLSTQKVAKETLNQIGCTNKSTSLAFDNEVLIGDYTGSAENSSLSIAFTSAGCYGNLRWEDATADGSVYIEELGNSRNTGRVTASTGGMAFNVTQIGVSADYNIKLYGSKATLAGAEFYVEKVNGANQNEIGVNTTNLIVKNKLFKTTTVAETFLDQVLLIRGKTKRIVNSNCRGIADLEAEDTVTLDHPAVNITNLYIIKGQKKTFESGSFRNTLLLEDTLLTSDDLRYDISLNYDMSLKYDGG